MTTNLISKHYLAPVPSLDRQLEEASHALSDKQIKLLLDDAKYYAAIKSKALLVGYSKLWPVEWEFLVEYTLNLHDPVKM